LRRIVAWEDLLAAYFLFRVLLDLTWIKPLRLLPKMIIDLPVIAGANELAFS